MSQTQTVEKRQHAYLVISRGQLSNMLKQTRKDNGSASTAIWIVDIHVDSGGASQAQISGQKQYTKPEFCNYCFKILPKGSI